MRHKEGFGEEWTPLKPNLKVRERGGGGGRMPERVELAVLDVWASECEKSQENSIRMSSDDLNNIAGNAIPILLQDDEVQKLGLSLTDVRSKIGDSTLEIKANLGIKGVPSVPVVVKVQNGTGGLEVTEWGGDGIFAKPLFSGLLSMGETLKTGTRERLQGGVGRLNFEMAQFIGEQMGLRGVEVERTKFKIIGGVVEMKIRTKEKVKVEEAPQDKLAGADSRNNILEGTKTRVGDGENSQTDLEEKLELRSGGVIEGEDLQEFVRRTFGSKSSMQGENVFPGEEASPKLVLVAPDTKSGDIQALYLIEDHESRYGMKAATLSQADEIERVVEKLANEAAGLFKVNKERIRFVPLTRRAGDEISRSEIGIPSLRIDVLGTEEPTNKETEKAEQLELGGNELKRFITEALGSGWELDAGWVSVGLTESNQIFLRTVNKETSRFVMLVGDSTTEGGMRESGETRVKGGGELVTKLRELAAKLKGADPSLIILTPISRSEKPNYIQGGRGESFLKIEVKRSAEQTTNQDGNEFSEIDTDVLWMKFSEREENQTEGERARAELEKRWKEVVDLGNREGVDLEAIICAEAEKALDVKTLMDLHKRGLPDSLMEFTNKLPEKYKGVCSMVFSYEMLAEAVRGGHVRSGVVDHLIKHRLVNMIGFEPTAEHIEAQNSVDSFDNEVIKIENPIEREDARELLTPVFAAVGGNAFEQARIDAYAKMGFYEDEVDALMSSLNRLRNGEDLDANDPVKDRLKPVIQLVGQIREQFNAKPTDDSDEYIKRLWRLCFGKLGVVL